MSIENMNHKSRNPKFSKIHIKSPDDIIITYSWSNASHGICGHNFEAYELTKTLKTKNINGGKITYLIPDNDDISNNIKDALKSKYQEYDSSFIINGKPEVLTAKTVILCDGCLPTKGIINAQTLVLILCGNDPWWIKNIKTFTGDKLEIWFDQRLEYPITQIVCEIHKIRPELQIKIRSNYIKTLAFNLYKTPPLIKTNELRFMVYSTGNCRDIYKADYKYKSDSLKEIKDIINSYENVSKTLLILGWNPEYTIEEKIYFNSHKDQKIFEDRKRSSQTACDLSEYFDLDVTIVPECDLPIDNIFNEFDIYIYTPTERNWDCSSRLIPECKFFGKEVILTETTKSMINENLGLKVRIKDFYPSLLEDKK